MQIIYIWFKSYGTNAIIIKFAILFFVVFTSGFTWSWNKYCCSPFIAMFKLGLCFGIFFKTGGFYSSVSWSETLVFSNDVLKSPISLRPFSGIVLMFCMMISSWWFSMVQLLLLLLLCWMISSSDYDSKIMRLLCLSLIWIASIDFCTALGFKSL